MNFSASIAIVLLVGAPSLEGTIAHRQPADHGLLLFQWFFVPHKNGFMPMLLGGRRRSQKNGARRAPFAQQIGGEAQSVAGARVDRDVLA
jgi:hypothetical protein